MVKLKGIRLSPRHNLAFILKKNNAYQRLTKEETRSKKITVPATLGQGCQQYPSNESSVVKTRITNIDYFI